MSLNQYLKDGIFSVDALLGGFYLAKRSIISTFHFGQSPHLFFLRVAKQPVNKVMKTSKAITLSVF